MIPMNPMIYLSVSVTNPFAIDHNSTVMNNLRSLAADWGYHHCQPTVHIINQLLRILISSPTAPFLPTAPPGDLRKPPGRR